MKFAIGQQVVEKEALRAHSSYNVLKVVAILDGALLLEHYGFGCDGEVHHEDWEDKPGTRGWRESLQRYQESDLLTLEEAVEELHRLEAAESKLNQEFETVRDQVQEKLEQAAALVKEAASLTTAHDKSFYDLKRECMPLYLALNEGGWRHSHMEC